MLNNEGCWTVSHHYYNAPNRKNSISGKTFCSPTRLLLLKPWFRKLYDSCFLYSDKISALLCSAAFQDKMSQCHHQPVKAENKHSCHNRNRRTLCLGYNDDVSICVNQIVKSDENMLVFFPAETVCMWHVCVLCLNCLLSWAIHAVLHEKYVLNHNLFYRVSIKGEHYKLSVNINCRGMVYSIRTSEV